MIPHLLYGHRDGAAVQVRQTHGCAAKRIGERQPVRVDEIVTVPLELGMRGLLHEAKRSALVTMD